jgi:hypothetical protein
VLELLRGLPAGFWPRPCKRIRDWQERGIPLSSNTGAYNQARQSLPLSVVEQSCDRIFEQLHGRMAAGSDSTVRTFLLDGTSMRMAHSPALIQSFPLSSNQYGEHHWPVMRVLVAHELQSGLAMRPEWGPMHGPEAISEQQLLATAIGRLPAGATVIADRNFGVFSVAYAALQAGHPVLLRLTKERAERLAGEPLQDGMDRTLVWKPSQWDRKSHPDLPEDAYIQGRLLVSQVQPDNGDAPMLLALFTTLAAPEQELLKLYGQRWAIETDLRTLKRELRLDHLSCATPEMAAKEIEMSMAAYNLVRAVIGLAAEQSGIPPRGYGFTKVRRIIETLGPMLGDATDPGEAKRRFDQMMYYVQQAKLPRRRRKRPSYPRAVWNKGSRFSSRKSEPPHS